MSELYEIVLEALAPVATGRMPRNPRADAQDLVHDTFLRAFAAMERFDGRAELRAWIFGIATKLLQRISSSRRSQPLDSLAELPAELVADQHPHVVLELEERTSQVCLHLDALPSRQRLALEQHYFRDRSLTEIASSLECSQAAAKSLLERGRTTLRRQLRPPPMKRRTEQPQDSAPPQPASLPPSSPPTPVASALGRSPHWTAVVTAS